MPEFSREEYEFLEISLDGELMPPCPMMVVAPEDTDPYWEFDYEGGLIILATGNVVMKARIKEELKVVDGGKPSETKGRRRITSIDKVKESEGDVI